MDIAIFSVLGQPGARPGLKFFLFPSALSPGTKGKWKLPAPYIDFFFEETFGSD